MPKFMFYGDVHVAAQCYIDADTIEEALERVSSCDDFDDVSTIERPHWFVWNGDVVFDEDGNEVEIPEEGDGKDDVPHQ